MSLITAPNDLSRDVNVIMENSKLSFCNKHRKQSTNEVLIFKVSHNELSGQHYAPPSYPRKTEHSNSLPNRIRTQISKVDTQKQTTFSLEALSSDNFLNNFTKIN